MKLIQHFTIWYKNQDGIFCPIKSQYFDVNNERLLITPTMNDGICHPKRIPAPPIRPSVTKIPENAENQSLLILDLISWTKYYWNTVEIMIDNAKKNKNLVPCE